MDFEQWWKLRINWRIAWGLTKKHKKLKSEIHIFSRYPCNGSVKTHTSTKSILTPYYPFFLHENETFHGPFGDMWFHFRNDWPLRMWPSNSLRRSGNSWTLLRGPCTRMWCWRPTGTCCLWVRMTSFQSCHWVSAFSLCAPWEDLMSFIWEIWWLGHDTASQG